MHHLREILVANRPLKRTSEVPVHFIGARQNNRAGRNSLNQPVSFVRTKYKCLVFLDRRAERGPELILFVVQKKRIEISPGVQRIVADELVEIAVYGVRPGFGDDVHHRTRVPPVFGVKRIGQNAKFFDGIR